jgi:hypothetical protein
MATKKIKEEIKDDVVKKAKTAKRSSSRKPRVKKVKPVEVKEEVEQEVLPQVENAVYEATKAISEHKESVEEVVNEAKDLTVESVSLATRIKLFVKKLFKK